MTYAEQAHLAAEKSFQRRVEIATVTQALGVMRETPPGYDTAGLRVTLAEAVLADAADKLVAFAWAVAANPAIAADSDDGTLLFAVADVWDEMSGITGNPS